ncbi:hypothetical protein niasHT_023153 [Heterodera trifolii]|uniref:Uncharacterized protein n=1 Tax=Heterodera trifolii TaxID=157864 RepID=A0ABD2JDY9_9BILA
MFFFIKGLDVNGCKIEELASIDDDEQRTIFGLILRFRGRHGEEMEGTPMPNDSVYFAQRPATPPFCLRRRDQTNAWRMRCCPWNPALWALLTTSTWKFCGKRRKKASTSAFLFATEGPNERVENAVLPVEPGALGTLDDVDMDIFVKKKKEE